MKLVLICAFLPVCLGLVTNESCMGLIQNFEGITSGSELRLCTKNADQCCTQANEDFLGMKLNEAISTGNFGVELVAMLPNAMALDDPLSYIRISLIDDVLLPLMRAGVDPATSPQSTNLQSIIVAVADAIDNTIRGERTDTNLTEEITKYFIGLSAHYYNFSFPGNTDEDDRRCGVNATYFYLFPPSEQYKIAALGRSLDRITLVYDIARHTLQSMARLHNTLDAFDVTSTCAEIWTQQYACPLCAGQATPLCQRRCNEVLIGCFSSLQQAIVQLNTLVDFMRANLLSLLTGNPLSYLNLNDIAANFTDIFTTSLSVPRQVVIEVAEVCSIGNRRRSVDDLDALEKRQTGVTFPSVSLNQTLVTLLTDTLIPAVMNVTLDSDRLSLCTSLGANGPTLNCTIGVGDVGSYLSSFNAFEIADQVSNPTGSFNTSQLRYQAGQLPYVLTDILGDNATMMLYYAALQGRPAPSLSFLNATDVTPTSTTTTTTPGPTRTPGGGGGGGAAAITCSMLTTLVAMLLASTS